MMSKNDNSGRKPLKPAWQAIEESDKRLAEQAELMTVHVQPTNKMFIAVAPRLIRAAQGKIIETLPFGNTGREQYKVAIKSGNFDALTDAWPVLVWSVDGPFRRPYDMNIRTVHIPSKDL